MRMQPRGVDVAGRGDGRIDQAGGPGEELGRVLVQQPARHVEVVDGEVAEEAAAGRDEGRRRRRGVVADQVQRFQRADLAGRQPRLQRAVVRIEALVEGDVERLRRPLQRDSVGAQPRQVEVERLLAEHRLAGRQRRQHEVEVGAGGGGDQHRRDRRIGEHAVHAADRAAELGGHRARDPGVRIDDADQVEARVGGGVPAMHLAHAPGPQQRHLRRAAHAAAAVRRPCAYGLMGSC